MTLAIRNVGKSMMFNNSSGMKSFGPRWNGVKGILCRFDEVTIIFVVGNLSGLLSWGNNVLRALAIFTNRLGEICLRS